MKMLKRRLSSTFEQINSHTFKNRKIEKLLEMKYHTFGNNIDHLQILFLSTTPRVPVDDNLLLWEQIIQETIRNI